MANTLETLLFQLDKMKEVTFDEAARSACVEIVQELRERGTVVDG